MGVLTIILVFCLLILAAGMRVGGLFLLFAFMLVMAILGVSLLVRFVQWVFGYENPKPPGGQRVSGGTGHGVRLNERHTCPNALCGMINESRARFCARCGTRLR